MFRDSLSHCNLGYDQWLHKGMIDWIHRNARNIWIGFFELFGLDLRNESW